MHQGHPHGGHCRCGPFRVNIIPQGLLKPYVLRLLSEKPMHGFEMMEEIYQRTMGMWRPGPSAIYPLLEGLEEEHYIEQMPTEGKGEKARRPYRITAKGRDAVKDFEEFRKEWTENVTRLRDIW